MSTFVFYSRIIIPRFAFYVNISYTVIYQNVKIGDMAKFYILIYTDIIIVICINIGVTMGMNIYETIGGWYQFVLDGVMPHNVYYDFRGRKFKSWKGEKFEALEPDYARFAMSGKHERFTGRSYAFYVTVCDPLARRFDLDNLDVKRFTDAFIKPIMIKDDDSLHLATVMDSAKINEPSRYPLLNSGKAHTEVFVLPEGLLASFLGLNRIFAKSLLEG